RRTDRRARLGHEPRGDDAAAEPEPRRHHDRAGDARARHRGACVADDHVSRRPSRLRPASGAAAGPGHRPPRARRRRRRHLATTRAMSFLATLRIALAALRVNKLRSALTMLGIIIGVGAVIAMTAIGAGAQARVEDQIKSLGSNLIIVLPGNLTSGGVRMGFGSQLTLSEDDASALPREIAEIEVAAP